MNDKPVIVSLGYNCEISFRIEDYYGKLDSYLFSWSFEDSRKGFIKALENIEDVFEGDLELCPDHMIRDKKYQIRFHPRYDILPKFGETTDKQFEEAVKELKSIDPLPALISKNELMVPLPTSEYELNDKNYLKNKIKYIRASRKVDAFFKDMVKNPEVSILLLVSDAYGDGGERRKIILNKDIKFVGINSGMVGNSFVAYFAFSS